MILFLWACLAEGTPVGSTAGLPESPEAPRATPRPASASPGPSGGAAPAVALEGAGSNAPPIEAYRWGPTHSARLAERVPAPSGHERVATDAWGEWLRALPVYPGDHPVLAYDGREIAPASAVVAVLDLDVGSADLQQCADTVLRLRAEYLWSVGDKAALAWRYTSGDLSSYRRWAAGERATVRGSSVSWSRRAAPSDSYADFRAWLNDLFTYAGTRSLVKEGVAADPANPRPGDFLVIGGSPGHALILLDVAKNADGRHVALVAEGYMPAQEAHVLPGPLSGWYPVNPTGGLSVPTWPDPFLWSGLRRFGASAG